MVNKHTIKQIAYYTIILFSDLCESPTACGVNALCIISNHQKQCSCPLILEGDPLFACRYPQINCKGNSDCNSGQTCYSSTCQAVCQT